jgi:hypothetical protein
MSDKDKESARRTPIADVEEYVRTALKDKPANARAGSKQRQRNEE